jgi:cell division protein FtsQ
MAGKNIIFKKKKLFFVIILTGFFFLGFIANKWRTDLTLERIIIEGNNLLSADAVIKSSGIKLGASLYEYDLKDIETRVLKNPYVKYALVQRNLPSVVEITIVERKPIALLFSDRPYYMDAEKKVFSYNFHKELLDLPVITGAGSELGSKAFYEDNRLDSVILILNKILKEHEDIYNTVSEINISDSNNFICYTTNENIPILLGKGDLRSKFDNLETFLIKNIVSSDLKKIEFIDLRYRDQVVIKWK